MTFYLKYMKMHWGMFILNLLYLSFGIAYDMLATNFHASLWCRQYAFWNMALDFTNPKMGGTVMCHNDVNR